MIFGISIVILFATIYYTRQRIGLQQLDLTRLFPLVSKTMVYFRFISVYYQFTQSYIDTLFYLFNNKVHGDYIQKMHETDKYNVFEQRFLKQSGSSIYTHTFKTLFPTLDFNLNTTFDCTELLSKSQCILNVSVQSLQFSGSNNTSHSVLSLDYTRQFREFASHIVLEPSLTFKHLDLIKEYLGLTHDCTISIVTSDLDLVVFKPQSLESNSISNVEQETKVELEQETKVCAKLENIDDISIKQIDVSINNSFTPPPQQISPSNSSSSFSISKSKNLQKKKSNFISFWWDK